MDDKLIENLPVAQRLALAYAPAPARRDTLSLLIFDQELAAILRKTSEPILAQMRLAWWRDNLALDPARRPRGNVVLDRLGKWPDSLPALIALVDGWESLLAESLNAEAVAGFAQARGIAWEALSHRLGHVSEGETAGRAGRIWALADLAANISDAEERSAVLEMAQREGPQVPRLPRTLRPLAILAGLGARSLAKGGAPLISGPASTLAAIRLGMLGR